jgi:hypothetical protein
MAGLVRLASGAVLGLGSRYGLVSYWWVGAKLVLNAVLTTLVLVALRPGMSELGAVGRQLAAGRSVPAALGGMVFPPVVSSLALLVAFTLSVFKPWGRIGWRKARAR